ncbi:Arc family DNA-binding protein [Sinorhizobium meliloti]|uniref:Arc family DNA-binding protein n=1 Tax=Rhizobium meliloti TaxID=382 RepID=UPI00299DB5FD|nr:Arc family DNA-binding protein [Sinorhizobium meliloti]MDW9997110.1 Arc family DNA-binding protein [Sinorhizobium meliloti]
MNKTTRKSDQFPLRLPDGLRDRLRAAAEENRRSMNAEIVVHLERAVGNTPEKMEGDARS